jgi:hypothetical protein
VVRSGRIGLGPVLHDAIAGITKRLRPRRVEARRQAADIVIAGQRLVVGVGGQHRIGNDGQDDFAGQEAAA